VPLCLCGERSLWVVPNQPPPDDASTSPVRWLIACAADARRVCRSGAHSRPRQVAACADRARRHRLAHLLGLQASVRPRWPRSCPHDHADFIEFSAVLSGIKEISRSWRRRTRPQYGTRTIVFVDEVHRFNKAQQDAFLPYVEKAASPDRATTENPSFEIISALLSRTGIHTQAADRRADCGLLQRALHDEARVWASCTSRRKRLRFARSRRTPAETLAALTTFST